jgi:hypothetical protein
MEIILSSYLEKAYVVRQPGFSMQIHISTEMNLDSIKNQLTNDLTSEEFEAFERLWSNDWHARAFVKGENYLKIMNKE